jgi:hypothetical protein
MAAGEAGEKRITVEIRIDGGESVLVIQLSDCWEDQLATEEQRVPVEIRIDGRDPIETIAAPQMLLDQIEAALNDGTVLRLETDQGTLLLNGSATSSVLVLVQQPTTAEPLNI